MVSVHVTGGTGFVGSHLCNRLAENHDVTAVSRSPERSPVEITGEVERRTGDVTDFDSLDFTDADAVVHLVSLSPLYKTGGLSHYDVTLRGTENVVDASERDGVDYLLHMSALDADVDGATEYLRAKGRAEEVVRGSGVDSGVLRPSVVFGEGGEFEGFCRRTTTPYVTFLPGGGRTRFQPLWVGDLVEMMDSAVEEQRTGVWEVGGSDVLSLAEVSRLVHRADGRGLKVLPVPMAFARLGMTAAEYVPGAPFGVDQYRSLKLDNVVRENQAPELGVEEYDLRIFAEYLDVEL